jgi:hypothetical protein
MRLIFSDGERERLAQTLGLPTHHVTDDILARAIAARLQSRPELGDGSSYYRDIDIIDASDLSAADRRARKRELYERQVAAQAQQRRREYTPSDADDRAVEFEAHHGYAADWLTDAEHERIRAAEAEAHQRRRAANRTVLAGPGALRAASAAKQPAERRVYFGQGYSVRPSGNWLGFGDR